MAAHLSHEASEHTFCNDDETGSGMSACDSQFWTRHQVLDSAVASAFISLPDHIRFPLNANDASCIFVNLRLHMANICLCRT
ncbi:hypothetical protein Micbo1qcDRAFT_159860, partial [Microdochium bolleyi]